MKFKEFKTGKGAFLVIELNENEVYLPIKGYDYLVTDDTSHHFVLPVGHWLCLGDIPSITEEQAKGVVDEGDYYPSSDVFTLGYRNYFFDDLNRILQYTVIIDWFDSVGVYVTVDIWHRDKGVMYFGWTIGDFHGSRYSHDKLEAISRQEATKQAILKANKLYNNQNINNI